MRGTTAAVLGFCIATTFARAGVTPTDPGLFAAASYEQAFEARARLDSGGSDWKSAIFGAQSATPLATGGSQGAGVWKHGKYEDFTFAYDAASDRAEFSVAGKKPSAILADIGANLAAISITLVANAGNTAELSGLEASINGGAWEALPGGGYSASGGEVSSPLFMMDGAVATLALRGEARFLYTTGAPGDALGFGLRGFSGSPMPEPASMVLAGVAGLAALRRGRAGGTGRPS